MRRRRPCKMREMPQFSRHDVYHAVSLKIP
nr:MAG TPA: hypothetical protein [Caudoviricetes sp.]